MKGIVHKQITLLMAVMVGAVLSTANLTAGNLLVDPGYEMQTPPEEGGWIPFGVTWWSSDYAHSGNWSIVHAAWYDVPGAYQGFPAAPGSKWQMTGYGMAPIPLSGEPAFGVIQVSFFDIYGNDLGTVETSGTATPAKISNPVNSGTPPGEWVFLDTGVATAPEGAAFICAYTLYVDFTGLWQGVCFDDVDLEVLGVTHGGYVSSIAHNADTLKRAGLITGQQSAEMVVKAAQSAGGK